MSPWEKCSHTLGEGTTLEPMRDERLNLDGYRCKVCGDCFALGRLFLEPREEGCVSGRDRMRK